MNAFMNDNWSDLFNSLSPSLFSVWSQIISTIFSGFDKLVPFDVVFPENLPEWLHKYISNSMKSCHCIRLVCVTQQSQNTRKQKPMFHILEICDWPWNLGENRLWVHWKFNLSVIFRTLLQQVVLWLYVVGACCNQCHIHYISCNFQIICSKKIL